MDTSIDDVVSFAKQNGHIPVNGWHAPFSLKEKRSYPPKPPSFKTVTELFTMAMRYLSNVYFPKKRVRSLPFMDHLNPVKMESKYGVPLGGIGCGTIGRGYKGEFCRSSLLPGIVNHSVNPVDLFIVTVKQGKKVYQQVLSTAYTPPRNAPGLRTWEWGFPENEGHYVALYPRSWTVYNLPEVQIVLICEQISPIIPKNYKDSCLPVGAFRWSILNFGKEDATVSITLTWRGPRYKYRPAPPNAGNAGEQCVDVLVNDSSDTELPRPHQKRDITIPFDSEDNRLHGCLMETQISPTLPCCYGIAARYSADVQVTRCMGFQYSPTTRRNPSAHGASTVPDESIQNSSGESYEQWNTSSSTRSSRTSFSHTKAPSAADIWLTLKQSGALSDDSRSFIRQCTTKTDPKLAMAVCASCTVTRAKTASKKGVPQPGRQTLDLFVTWHFPRVHFRSADIAYKRRYTRWFPIDLIMGAGELLSYAVDNVDKWRKAIEQWQAPVLNDPNLPHWYKSALFNELYYMSDGASVWLDPLPHPEHKSSLSPDIPPIDFVRSTNPNVCLDPLHLTGRRPLHKHVTTYTSSEAKTFQGNSEDVSHKRGKNGYHISGQKHIVKAFKERTALGHDMGLFGYLEGHEYRMYNTYDVHFNASWAMIQLWPKLQLAVNYDLADITISEDKTPVTYIYKGQTRICNAALAVPHDCGDPEDEPWKCINAYIMYPTDEWKDLCPKFIIMAWRDWMLTGDQNYLLYMVPIVVSVIRNCLQLWDSDGDGVIENGCFPDQTFDMMRTTGLSSFVGGLWIAALYAGHEMLKAANKLCPQPAGNAAPWSELDDNLASLFQRANDAYHSNLWNGNFYRYDMFVSQINAPVLLDQLCGYGFLRVGGAPSGCILTTGSVSRTLKTLVELNWKSVKEGKIGAINSVYSNSKADNSNMQAQEFWCALNYNLGALLIAEGMPQEGFDLAGSCFKHVFHEMGLHFQTPEAYTRDNTYRSLAYMRPLAIWSMHRAIQIVVDENDADYKNNDYEKFQLLQDPDPLRQQQNNLL